jgi:hypothetical protein
MIDHIDNYNTIISTEALDTLTAERESHLQPLVFVEPDRYAAYTGMRSLVIVGDSGSGKTALRLALTRQVAPENTPPTYLVVNWQPEPFEDVHGSPAVRVFVRQALHACATTLLTILVKHPDLFRRAPPTVQMTFHWFIQAHISADRQHLWASMAEQAVNDEGKALGQHLIFEPATAILYPDTTEQRIIAHLTATLQRIGIRGVWVTIDGFDPWLRGSTALMSELMIAILSTLELLDLNGFAIKMFAPRALESDIARSWGIVKGRIELDTLTWTPEQLTTITERHIAAKIGKPSLHLSDLCVADRDIRDWLQRYGGSTPRGWLRLIRPLVDAFAAAGASHSLPHSVWNSLKRTHPPRLSIDLKADRVFIGEAEIVGLQPRSYRLLRYLYENRSRRVPRSELYYRAYLGLAEEPRTRDDHGWEDPANWTNVLDNAILRLRRIIEPDPRHPIYIITNRGWGVKLEHAN